MHRPEGVTHRDAHRAHRRGRQGPVQHRAEGRALEEGHRDVAQPPGAPVVHQGGHPGMRDPLQRSDFERVAARVGAHLGPALEGHHDARAEVLRAPHLARGAGAEAFEQGEAFGEGLVAHGAQSTMGAPLITGRGGGAVGAGTIARAASRTTARTGATPRARTRAGNGAGGVILGALTAATTATRARGGVSGVDGAMIVTAGGGDRRTAIPTRAPRGEQRGGDHGHPRAPRARRWGGCGRRRGAPIAPGLDAHQHGRVVGERGRDGSDGAGDGGLPRLPGARRGVGEQGRGEVPHAREAMGRQGVQRDGEGGAEPLGEVGTQRARVFAAPLADRREQPEERGGVVGAAPAEALVEHHPEGVLIAPRVPPGAVDLLGAEVEGRAHEVSAGARGARRVVGAGHAEVEHLRHDASEGAGEKEVLGLEVAVHHPRGMHRVDRGHHREQEVQRLGDREGTLATELRGEVFAVEEFHHEKGHAVFDADVGDIDHVGVAHPRGGAALAEKARDALGLGEGGCVQGLQRHALAQVHVLGLVHRAHAPAPDGAEEGVAAEARGGGAHGAVTVSPRGRVRVEGRVRAAQDRDARATVRRGRRARRRARRGGGPGRHRRGGRRPGRRGAPRRPRARRR
jgi:hypothetical protein